MSGKGSPRKPSPIDTNRPKEDGYLDPSGYAENGYENAIVGVCAMDQKARSRAMQNILDRLMSYGRYQVIIFGDQTILNEGISISCLFDECIITEQL
ncbi:Inositol hexakisphosphate and diphosphoinositol-pentakisphosphate kinase [Zancudomyces culisetae]|uniref:Inositol hexakisphosphate and diphosphoinositol-pentakisphosphate kinase n=1 Tax=Zancudomyces culisetae TaxID=1213189 RepID=A0A1R1PEU3_ZANCU|nr:Inositol hexakisphosphate and diphosphoinositol-pentakisphosphate kinase [Zancudomyces culisetae]|eukprot:OMH79449.1 Inositol hexakisphosphate and diphosphoinositol-pentakisphosphate kinase [Zancudomyces culisetae]